MKRLFKNYNPIRDIRVVVFIAILITLALAKAFADQYQGQLTVNPTVPGAISPKQQFSPYSSAKVYNSKGEFRGNLNGNQFDPYSVSNEFGKYGSQFSPTSINNELGEGSEFHPDSPNNQFSEGWSVWE